MVFFYVFFLIVLASKPNLHNGDFRLTYQQQPTTSPWPPESSDGPRFVGLVQLFGLEENRRVLLLGEGSLARCAFPNFPGKKVGRLHSLRLTISPLKISHPKRKLHLPLSFEEGIYKQVQNLQTHWVSKQSRVAKREFSTCHLVNILRERVVWDFFSQAEIYGSYHQLEGIDQLHWENMGSLQILISTSFGWALKFWVSSPFHLLFFGGLSPLPPHQRPFKNWWGKFFPKLWPHWSGFEMNLWGETKHSCKANFFCSWNFGPWMKMYFQRNIEKTADLPTCDVIVLPGYTPKILWSSGTNDSITYRISSCRWSHRKSLLCFCHLQIGLSVHTVAGLKNDSWSGIQFGRILVVKCSNFFW